MKQKDYEYPKAEVLDFEILNVLCTSPSTTHEDYNQEDYEW